MTKPEDDEPTTVRVPIRPPGEPLGTPEYADVPADTAGQWDLRQWHERPPL